MTTVCTDPDIRGGSVTFRNRCAAELDGEPLGASKGVDCRPRQTTANSKRPPNITLAAESLAFSGPALGSDALGQRPGWELEPLGHVAFNGLPAISMPPCMTVMAPSSIFRRGGAVRPDDPGAAGRLRILELPIALPETCRSH